MSRNTTLTSVALAAVVLLLAAITSSAATQTIAVQYGYDYSDAYRYSPRVYRYPTRTFDDYVAERLRQRRIQQYYGTPYYPQYDDYYYGRRRTDSYLYRPYYEGRQFRHNGPYNYRFRDDRYPYGY